MALLAAVAAGIHGYHALTERADRQISSQNADELRPDTRAAFLVRSTLMALNDANRTGNYTVLRDLAGPRFQMQNSATSLSASFHTLREANLDLSPAGMIAPTLSAVDIRDGDGVLALDGHVPLREHEADRLLRFSLEFEPVDGHWRLLTLSVSLTKGTGNSR